VVGDPSASVVRQSCSSARGVCLKRLMASALIHGTLSCVVIWIETMQRTRFLNCDAERKPHAHSTVCEQPSTVDATCDFALYRRRARVNGRPSTVQVDAIYDPARYWRR
jgi:hypothetical protein